MIGRFIHKRGFTLIELLVVISIIGVLASVILAGLQEARIKARDASIKESFLSLRSVIALYFNEYSDYSYMCDPDLAFPPVSSTVKTNLDRMAQVYGGGSPMSNGLFYKCFNGVEQYVIYLKLGDGDFRCLSSDNASFGDKISIEESELDSNSCAGN